MNTNYDTKQLLKNLSMNPTSIREMSSVTIVHKVAFFIGLVVSVGIGIILTLTGLSKGLFFFPFMIFVVVMIIGFLGSKILLNQEKRLLLQSLNNVCEEKYGFTINTITGKTILPFILENKNEENFSSVQIQKLSINRLKELYKDEYHITDFNGVSYAHNIFNIKSGYFLIQHDEAFLYDELHNELPSIQLQKVNNV